MQEINTSELLQTPVWAAKWVTAATCCKLLWLLSDQEGLRPLSAGRETALIQSRRDKLAAHTLARLTPLRLCNCTNQAAKQRSCRRLLGRLLTRLLGRLKVAEQGGRQDCLTPHAACSGPQLVSALQHALQPTQNGVQAHPGAHLMAQDGAAVPGACTVQAHHM